MIETTNIVELFEEYELYDPNIKEWTVILARTFRWRFESKEEAEKQIEAFKQTTKLKEAEMKLVFGDNVRSSVKTFLYLQ